MAPRKRARQEPVGPSSATAEARTTIDETHAVRLSRHLADLHKRRLFTDLKVRCQHPPCCSEPRRDFTLRVRCYLVGSRLGR